MIRLSNINKSLRGRLVLGDISFEFASGKCYLIQGANGSGKTMLLRMICGLIHPDSGEIMIDPPCDFGVMIEAPKFMEAETAWENLYYLSRIRKKIGESEIFDALRAVNLYDNKDKKVKTFSLGMKQRLAICQAVMEDPGVLLLDEPFNALDKANYDSVKEIIEKSKQDGKIVIIAAHMIDEGLNTLFDCKITIDEGKIISTVQMR